MRITRNMMISNFLTDLTRLDQQLSKDQRRISTGLEITVPSQSPGKAARILYFRSKISKVQQYQANIDHITLWTSQTNSILQNIYDLFLHAQELAERGATDTINSEQRAALAEEVNQMIDTLLGYANEKIENFYAFGGNYLSQKPFYVSSTNANGEATAVTYRYLPDTTQREEEVLEGKKESVNEIGSEIFQRAGGEDYFAVLIDLRDNLRAGTNISNSLNRVKNVIRDIDGHIARIANKHQRLLAIKTRLQDAELEYSKIKAGYEEADYTKAIMDFQKDQTAYQAALAVGARMMMPTLVDFLR